MSIEITETEGKLQEISKLIAENDRSGFLEHGKSIHPDFIRVMEALAELQKDNDIVKETKHQMNNIFGKHLKINRNNGGSEHTSLSDPPLFETVDEIQEKIDRVREHVEGMKKTPLNHSVQKFNTKRNYITNTLDVMRSSLDVIEEHYVDNNSLDDSMKRTMNRITETAIDYSAPKWQPDSIPFPELEEKEEKEKKESLYFKVHELTSIIIDNQAEGISFTSHGIHPDFVRGLEALMTIKHDGTLSNETKKELNEIFEKHSKIANQDVSLPLFEDIQEDDLEEKRVSRGVYN